MDMYFKSYHYIHYDLNLQKLSSNYYSCESTVDIGLENAG